METAIFHSESSAQDALVRHVPGGINLGIKVHFGRTKKPGSFIPPVFFDPLKPHVASITFFDTNTLYGGERGSTGLHLHVAKKHGFEPAVILEEAPEVVPGVPQALLDFDLVLNAAHLTGHKITGYGGCIKNIGMGMVTSGMKLWVHAASQIRFDNRKCKECGWCDNHCECLSPQGMDQTCIKCGKCIGNCKGVQFTFGKQHEVAQRLVQAAHKVIQNVPMLHLAYIHNPTKLCDCMGDATDKIIKHCFGVVLGGDAADVDSAAVDFAFAGHNKYALMQKQINELKRAVKGKRSGLGL